MLLRVVVREVDGQVVLSAVGEVDTSTADMVPDAVDAVLDAGGVRVFLDLSQVTFIDSSGASAVLAAHRAAEARDARLAVVSPSRQALRVIELLGLEDLLRIYDDLPAAIRDL